ncbi:hypothetical protein RG47T_4574 [Mucilaginibacter polytrichastri]|uniref:Uncharacterized protein n=1 Tax=Mucilaginibacter polytrichastri TaxID=1302689 RepID=A0A1Q6A518_9SPHI|nr:hypothetical protein RG47T_4574 [Mucilaginibacter polytrichastri]SFS96419.1 hypothetical protein SAMN04487890_107135 [Mucilaginibacter polytrichastri]
MIKALLPYKSLVKLLLITWVLCNFGAFAQKTTVFIVRHAEKGTSDTRNRDPNFRQCCN